MLSRTGAALSKYRADALFFCLICREIAAGAAVDVVGVVAHESRRKVDADFRRCGKIDVGRSARGTTAVVIRHDLSLAVEDDVRAIRAIDVVETGRRQLDVRRQRLPPGGARW